MLNTAIREIESESIIDMLSELGHVKSIDIHAHSAMTLFSFLQLCQRDIIRDKKERINAANFYKGSALKTKIEKLDDDLYDLTEFLCRHFRVSHEFAVTKTLYVFLNDIFNPKSKLRKPPPIRL